MKLQFKKTPIALALAAMFLSPIAFASDGQDGGDHHDRNPVKINKDLSLEQDVEIKGHVYVDGNINVDASSIAIVNNAQTSEDNFVMNGGLDGGPVMTDSILPIGGLNGGSVNDATVDGNALESAAGNIGLNVTAGDNNQQANAAALSAADASFVFGSSDAEVFALQSAHSNATLNLGHTNSAHLDGNALANAAGNIGVNISAGNSNQQMNDFAGSVAVASLATATVGLTQDNGHNFTINAPVVTYEVQDHAVDLAFNATGVSAGIVDQNGNQYPDTWTGNTHPGGSQTGHIDLDTAVQGASDRPVASALDSNGNPTGPTSTGGALSFNALSDIALAGSVTGNLPVVVAVNLNTTNTSHIGDNALQNASGNIGVNVATGTNNQQFNGLAISATQAGTGNGNGGGEN